MFSFNKEISEDFIKELESKYHLIINGKNCERSEFQEKISLEIERALHDKSVYDDER